MLSENPTYGRILFLNILNSFQMRLILFFLLSSGPVILDTSTAFSFLPPWWNLLLRFRILLNGQLPQTSLRLSGLLTL